MMCKNKSSLLAKFKPLLLLPIIASLFLIFTCNEKSTAQAIDEVDGIRQETDPETAVSYYVIEDMPTYKDGESSGVESNAVTPVETNEDPQDIQQDTVREEKEVFYVVEEMPQFNDGDPAQEFRIFIAQNLEYPESAVKDSISGRVIVQFCVNYEGKVIEPKVVRSVAPALDKEAIRVVSSSPLWTPGKQRGKTVDVMFTFPINFVLQKALK